MNRKKYEEELILLQLNDSQFPIGSYSHSYGLENYILKNLIKDSKDTKKYLINYLKTSFYYNDLLAVYLAYNYFIEGEKDELLGLNIRLQAQKSQKELREASEKLGSRLISTVHKMDIAMPEQYYDYLDYHKKNDIIIHHSVAYALITASLDIDLTASLLSFAFNMAQNLVITSVKTVPISQFDGQKILYELYDLIIDLVTKIDKLDEEYYFTSYPGVEVASMQHEVLYSRLYMS